MSTKPDQTSRFVSWEDAVSWLLTQPDQKDLVRQCYFDRPVIDAVRRYAGSEEWNALQEHIPQPAGRALDVGAGNGIVSYALAKQGWQVVALEPDSSPFVGAAAIRSVAAPENLPIDVIEQFGESMPFETDEFDLVIARQVVHHAADLGQMAAEMSRVLKPGGTLIAFRDHLIDDDDSLKEFQKSHPLHNLYGGENAFQINQYRDAYHDAGLEIDHELHQFDSIINYAPKTKDELCTSVSSRVKPKLAGRAVHWVLSRPMIFKTASTLASKCYRKPGRLVSFICRKKST
ncbi:class I SAM-dependent methyltransferase [Rubripirellula lacrimiformis]|uniref:class I SAM-dependent methyltransferase n=1 Tax=Rubripirellula lacrimiformis TaxID=1930273 RepID=UPI001C54D553|nr:class I SAM-dependent methyltransferase [Rubripirellula lacrimiformis]